MRRRGNALIQALLAVVITGLVTINMISVFSIMSKNQNWVNVSQSIQSTVEEVRLVLSKTALCSLNFQNNLLDTTGSFPIKQKSPAWTTSLSIRPPGGTNGQLAPPGNEIVRKDKDLGNGLTIEELDLSLTGVSGSTYYGKFGIHFKTSSASSTGPSSIIREIPVRFETINSGGTKVVSCGTQPELTMNCADELKIDYPKGAGGNAATHFTCNSASAEIIGCRQQMMPAGSTFCGTTIHARTSTEPPYCQTNGCNPVPKTQYWEVNLTCCESGGPVPVPAPPAIGSAIAKQCHRVVAPYSIKGPCGFTSTATCPTGEYLLSGGTTGGANVALQNSSSVDSSGSPAGWTAVFINTQGAGIPSCGINSLADGAQSDSSGCFHLTSSTGSYQLCGLAEAICCHD